MGQSTPPAGSPATISREDHRALLNMHMGKIRLANQEVEIARAPFDAARENLTATIDDARADLGKKKYPRKHLMSLLEDLGSRLRNLLAEEQQRYQDRVDLGLPVHGEQLSLSLGDAAIPQEKKDEMAWEAEGFLLGRAGKLNTIPEGCPTRFHQVVMKAAEAGQKVTQDNFLAAQEVIKARNTPNAAEPPKDLNAAPEPGSPEAKKAEREQIKAAKAGLEKLGAKGGEGFEASLEELGAQKPRLSVVDGKTGRTSGESQQAVA